MTEQTCYWSDASTRNCVWLFQIKESTDEQLDTHWRTERVFLTKEEARSHGKARPYEWGEENDGWRIYGVPCEGLMAEFLGKHDAVNIIFQGHYIKGIFKAVKYRNKC
jgi:hypothetical protein